jgi:hypothetical protein
VEIDSPYGRRAKVTIYVDHHISIAAGISGDTSACAGLDDCGIGNGHPWPES